MSDFVRKDSIVTKIWGKSDTILFIFAGAAGEFALNKAVDWLYFTGKLPSDPLGRLFSTVNYARWIVFSTEDSANAAIDQLRQIHGDVEQSRGASIPDWAYRDVLFMLIHYSIAAYELLETKLTDDEKHEVFDVFYRVGHRMGLKGLPQSYLEWLPVRQAHLNENLQVSVYTADLYRQYKKQLGPARFKVLVEGQKLVVPAIVKQLLQLGGFSMLAPVVPLYKTAKALKMDWLFKKMMLPAAYKAQIAALDVT